ncbi:MAG: hypothetical protein JWR38_5921 [Mucilaginibacter sp.]|nr:hypothetical protein [Mucilaginibacter sp.]
MELVLQKTKADAFVREMDKLAEKFNNIYLDGKLEDFVKLDKVKGNVELKFIKPVPEMVRIACTLVFVNTLI